MRPSKTALPQVYALSSLCAVAALVAGCSDDVGSDGRIDESETGLTSASTTVGTSESSETDSLDTETSATDTDDPMCEDDELVCGMECCASDQVCFEGSCAADCGGVDPCGPDKLCCAAGDVCYLGECVVPDGPCEDLSCATQVDTSTCEPGYVCDEGLCVPTQADPNCQYVPPPAEFAPRPEFTWGERKQVACVDESACQTAEICQDGFCTPTWEHLAPADAAENVHVSSIPLVADLDGDCVPEVIFNTYKFGVASSEGVVRALDGGTGAQLWSVTDPVYASDSTSNPAVGDIDSDGLPEVVYQGSGNSKVVVAIDSDGTPLWVSDPFAGGESSGSVAIANMDGAGDPEIVFGAAVYSSAGALLWEGNAGIGRDGQGPISCIADLDGDFRPELIGGNTAYKTTGSVAGGDFDGAVWWQAEIGDGRCGVADFDDDGNAEVIVVRGGSIYALDGQTGALIDEFNIPGSNDRGGAPNIADFNGDGNPEVATAGSTFYVVAEFDGLTFTELWRAPVEDDSSRVTGSSVFDFDGDGNNEVIYNDEFFIRIYPGVEPDCTLDPPGPNCDGIMDDSEVLFRDPNTSRTRTEYPVVADVDGDFKAELVFSTNADISWGLDAGIEVWGDALDNWVSTRPIWNQHSYHISNVGVDGSIPTVEPESWLFPEEAPFNSYRRNVQGASDFCAPNLVLFDMRAEAMSCPDLVLSVDVANLGCLGVGAGVNVSFYEATLGYLGTVQTQGQLQAGAKETVTFDAMVAMSNALVYAIVDDDGIDGGLLNECDEANESEQVPVCIPIE